jgi:hypothetical protein
MIIVEKKPRIYVAGPFRGETPWIVESNVRRAEEVGLRVAKLGAIPVIPHTMYRFYQGSWSDEFWDEATLSLLHTCQAMVVDRPHAEVLDSAGTLREIEDCHANKRFYFYDDDMDKLKLWITEQQRAAKIVNSSLYGKFGG